MTADKPLGFEVNACRNIGNRQMREISLTRVPRPIAGWSGGQCLTELGKVHAILKALVIGQHGSQVPPLAPIRIMSSVVAWKNKVYRGFGAGKAVAVG